LKEIKNTEIYILNIDGNHLQSFDRQLYTALVNYPTEIIPIMDGVSTQVYLEIYSNYSEARPNVFLQVRINSLANKSRIRDLNPSDIAFKINGNFISSNNIQNGINGNDLKILFDSGNQSKTRVSTNFLKYIGYVDNNNELTEEGIRYSIELIEPGYSTSLGSIDARKALMYRIPFKFISDLKNLDKIYLFYFF